METKTTEKLFLATKNTDKLGEILALVSPLGWQAVSMHEYPDFPEVEESKKTLVGNATLKANAGFLHTDLPTIADDTGLEVDALNGAPGVYSARYAGEKASYDDNVNKLLAELRPISVSEKRTARFRTVIVYTDRRQRVYFEGLCEGFIALEPKGENGFGYDPVFYPEGEDRTFAQMSKEEKGRHSHRGRALTQFMRWFEKHSQHS